jgi:hypothetical protein
MSFPAAAGSATTAPAAAKPSESASTPPAATKAAEPTAESAAEPAAKRTHAAVPAAPRSAAPAAAPATSPAARQDHDDDPDEQDDLPGSESARRLNGPPLPRHVLQFDAAPLGNAVDDPGRAGEQARRVVAVAELRPHHLANRLAGEAVGDELLEVVADLDAHLAFLERDHDQCAVVLALVPDPAAAVLEHPQRELVDVRVRLHRRYGGDDDHVAARLLQRANAPVELSFVRRVDGVAEVVDGRRERRGRRLLEPHQAEAA